jgi:hypothetical protein
VSPYARTVLKRYDEATREIAFIGAAEPGARHSIQKEYDEAKAALARLLEKK